MACGGRPAGGMDDELMPLQCDEDQREDGDCDGHALHERRDLAQRLTQDPAVHERVDNCYREAYHAHEDVGAGEVGNEDVGDVPHLLLSGYDEDQTSVAHQSHRNNSAVGHDQKGRATHRGRAHVGLNPCSLAQPS